MLPQFRPPDLRGGDRRHHVEVPAAPVLALGAAGGVPGSLGVVEGDGRIPYTPEARAIKDENAANWILCGTSRRTRRPAAPSAGCRPPACRPPSGPPSAPCRSVGRQLHVVQVDGARRAGERAISLSPAGAFGSALVPALALAAFVLVDRVHDNPTLFRSFLGAALALGAWNVLLLAGSLRGGRRRTLEIAPRAQHYLQVCAQGSVLLYWGWHWAPVYDAVPLIAGQLVFAYEFDLLLGWSRRDNHRLGFGPVPVIFSINLFLWFTDDWFHFQFLLVAIGFAAKELIRWERDHGRLVHIFNAASFPLAVFALALIVTGLDRRHAEAGHRHLAVLSAADVPVDIPDRAARPVPVRRDRR